MNDETSVEDVALSDELEAIDGVVVLRVGEARKEVEDDLEEEEELRVLEHLGNVIVNVTKGDDMEVEQHVWDHNDGDEDMEHGDEPTVCVQNVPADKKDQCKTD